jgi:hypothetical protein
MAAATLIAAPASAQLGGSIAIGVNVSRSVSKRSQDKYPLYVSYADCLSKDVFTFPLTLTNLSTPSQMTSIEVWQTEGGSNDCTIITARSGTAPTCKLVHQEAAGAQKSITIKIPSADIANALTSVKACDDTGASTVPRDVRLYFLAIRSSTVGSDVPATDAAVFDKTKVDLLGPAAPTNLTAGVGENSLILSYTASTEKDKLGYDFFCDEGAGSPVGDGGVDADAGDAATGAGGSGGGAAGAGGAVAGAGGAATAAASGGGGAATAGAGGTGGASSGEFPGAAKCPPSVLVPGQRPDTKLQCGSTTAPSGTASGLPNGVEVVVGVAAFDQVGNLGKLSDLACATPNPIDDFFKLYRQSGGQAGGGFCSIGVAPTASLFSAVALGMAAAGLARRRSRRRAPGDRR